jgi:lon-related putative ATP-dependent protease
MRPKPLSREELRWSCPESVFGFGDSSEIETTDRIVGQDRAVDAVRLGLKIPSIGYNMFVTGVSGTGRETTVKRVLDSIDTTTRELTDICYVHNLEDPQKPKALVFPAGGGREFVDDMEESLELLRSNLPAVAESERTALEKRALMEEAESTKKELMAEVEEKAGEEGFAVVNIPVGPQQYRPDVLPVIEEKPATFDKLEEMVREGELAEERLEEYRRLHQELFSMLAEAYRKAKRIDMDLRSRVAELYRRLLEPTVSGILARLKEGRSDQVNEYASEMGEAILDNLETFLGADEEEGDPYAIFMPNLLVDNSDRDGCPVILEQFPDWVSLFGNIDRVVVNKRPYSDHTMIQGGTVLQANGGFLVLEAMDLVRKPDLWQNLIQTLRSQTAVIRAHDPLSLHPVKLQPEPVDINVKVILLGPSWLYSLLASHDPEFSLLFRVRADFTDRMDVSDDSLEDFANVIANIVRSEELPHLEAGAMAALAEEAVRLTGDQKKISLEFSRVADYVRQAAYWASEEGSELIRACDIHRAAREKRRRLSLPEDRAIEAIVNRDILIDTDGAEVGQVNGLAVYSTVDYSFGLPVRITARVSAGRQGIVDVEREAELSGAIHTKGIQIITGHLRGRFASDYPLSLSASICFEQSYGGIDGDSASSTELYALLSVLAGVPIRQDLAVTGSVNQRGQVQAIGGVNHKVEGFFRLCRQRGLTGDQGVLVPASNRHHLQLEHEVLDAVEEGSFHIYPVSTIDEGIELLTGMEAGQRQEGGEYPEDTINGLADRRLRGLAETLRSFRFSG